MAKNEFGNIDVVHLVNLNGNAFSGVFNDDCVSLNFYGDSVCGIVSLVVVSSIYKDFIEYLVEGIAKDEFFVFKAIFAGVFPNPEFLGVSFNTANVRVRS